MITHPNRVEKSPFLNISRLAEEDSGFIFEKRRNFLFAL